ncbi:MAG: hypothetical protein FD189_308 [Elusimicrobia bacterium]|nr:MAG: hypothetical protein FD154_108 [Elusimicrobiota bacterium]KAF0158041.1 MAG: hypothetical protein FD189_308 [Elusimicrobiota bacterium]
MLYRYELKFEDGSETAVEIRLDPVSLRAVSAPDGPLPDWTLLDRCKCPVCPFDSASEHYCPVAVNMAGVAARFADKSSVMPVEARVISDEREYFKRTSLQSALSSIIGVYMVTSGCPVMEVLKPMARYHLPFASLNETVYRSVSSYLTRQYLAMKKGEEPDWSLERLKRAYADIEVLNRAMADRIRQASSKDANCNAIVILDSFAKMVPWSLDNILPGDELGLADS